MDGEFDRATAVRDLGDGAYAATVTHGWDIGGNANGGFLTAICGRAMADRVGRPPLTVRLRPGDEGFRLGEPTGRAEVAGWFAFSDSQPIGAIALLFVADAFPPPVFNTTLPVAWVPTLELTVHVRGVPSPGPLRCVYRSRFIQGGLVEEDGEMWDSRGVLAAQSRQLSLTPREL